MGSSVSSLSVYGLDKKGAVDSLVATALAKGYHVQKFHSDELKFRIQPLTEEDPHPTDEVLVIKDYGVFNINVTKKHARIRAKSSGITTPSPRRKVVLAKDEVNVEDNVKDNIEDNVENIDEVKGNVDEVEVEDTTEADAEAEADVDDSPSSAAPTSMKVEVETEASIDDQLPDIYIVDIAHYCSEKDIAVL